jgi:hypothetical protein
VRSVRILLQAAEETEAAAGWYERMQSGAQGAKRVILRRFPYDVVVIERDDNMLIVAVAHHSRKPGYWQDRI